MKDYKEIEVYSAYGYDNGDITISCNIAMATMINDIIGAIILEASNAKDYKEIIRLAKFHERLEKGIDEAVERLKPQEEDNEVD